MQEYEPYDKPGWIAGLDRTENMRRIAAIGGRARGACKARPAEHYRRMQAASVVARRANKQGAQ